ncbi:chlorophyll A-B binding protein [Aureococcus anophagefferens]|nr:chlorophyll A-B binding protein [Aureococcus anophagefferens]
MDADFDDAASVATVVGGDARAAPDAAGAPRPRGGAAAGRPGGRRGRALRGAGVHDRRAPRPRRRGGAPPRARDLFANPLADVDALPPPPAAALVVDGDPPAGEVRSVVARGVPGVGPRARRARAAPPRRRARPRPPARSTRAPAQAVSDVATPRLATLLCDLKAAALRGVDFDDAAVVGGLPYPSPETKDSLARDSRLSLKQVQHWFSNMRKRKYLKLGTGAGKRAPKDAFEAQLLALMPAALAAAAAPVVAPRASSEPAAPRRGRGAAGGRAGAPPPDDDEATIADDADLRTSFELSSARGRRGAVASLRRDSIAPRSPTLPSVRGATGASLDPPDKSPRLELREKLAIVAPVEGKSDFSDVQALPGILDPVGFFVPTPRPAAASFPFPDRALSVGPGEPRGRRERESELKRYREAELTHGRVAMLASVGFLVGESGATPLFGGNIDGIAINQFWKVPTGFWPVILLFIAVPETFRALRGWMEPTVPENYFVLRAGYTPGDIDLAFAPRTRRSSRSCRRRSSSTAASRCSRPRA